MVDLLGKSLLEISFKFPLNPYSIISLNHYYQLQSLNYLAHLEMF